MCVHIYTRAGLECDLAAATYISNNDSKKESPAVRQQANNEKPRAARDLIEYFHERMSRCQPYDEEILHRFMKHVFHQIIVGEKPADVAFGLKLGRGEYVRPGTTERDIRAAAYMEIGRRKSQKWLDTRGDVANRLFPDGTGEKAVEAADKEYRDVFKHFPDEMLEKIVR